VTKSDETPSAEELKAHADEGYRALGRYVAEFSLMIKEMIERLKKLLREYGRVCFGMHGRQLEGETVRVRDVVCLEKRRPVLGPKAIVFPRDRV